MKKELRCCFTKNKQQCKKKAIFEISENTRQDPDNYTHSCEKHLGKMIGTTEGFPECEEWTVTAL